MSVQEDSPGKSLLKNMRERRQQEEERANREFSEAAKQNFAIGKQVREKMSNQSRFGENGRGGIFAPQNDADRRIPPPKQSGHSLLSHVGQDHQNDQPQKAKENFRMQQPYEADRFPKKAGVKGGHGTVQHDNCAAKYDEMLQEAQSRRAREKMTPRSTNFY